LRTGFELDQTRQQVFHHMAQSESLTLQRADSHTLPQVSGGKHQRCSGMGVLQPRCVGMGLFTHNHLSSSSIRVYLCFGSWARSGLVVLSDVVATVSAIGKNIQ